MSAIPSYFTDFLSEIRLTPDERTDCETKHKELRERLEDDATLKSIVVATFLQGSFRRHTGVRVLVDGEHIDVDLVVVTTIDHNERTPADVVAMFKPFLDRRYPDHWSVNDRSMKIWYEDTQVTLDLVVTAAPSEIVKMAFAEASAAEWRIEAKGDTNGGPVALREAIEGLRKFAGEEQWKQERLQIPDRTLKIWVPTHPLEQIRWTEEKNAATGGHYVNVVKSGKWWRKRNAVPEYPKGYPLEHLIGQVCPDDINSVAEGLTRSFEAIRDNYRYAVSTGTVPSLPDHGVPENNVLRRVTPQDFAGFWRLVERAAGDARAAFDADTITESVTRWRALLGLEFPEPPKDGGFTERVGKTAIVTTGRYGSGRHG
jgi:hypothetical protein